MIGYWLIPAENEKRQLAALIRDLAQRYDAPVFEPHVTLYTRDDSEEDARRLLARMSAERAVELSVGGIAYSDKFTKTLFVQFEKNADAQRLSDGFGESSHSARQYDFDPHLSLLYADISDATKAREARATRLPLQRVVFDSLAAIDFPRPIKSRADVEAWRTIATAKLTG
jgi:2'-5' RNA ligase